MPCFQASYCRRSERSVKASSLVVQGSCRRSGDCSITFRPWNQPRRRSLEKHPSRRRFPWFDWVMSWHFHGPDPKSLECTINLQHPSLSSPNHPISRCICWSAPQVFHLETIWLWQVLKKSWKQCGKNGMFDTKNLMLWSLPEWWYSIPQLTIRLIAPVKWRNEFHGTWSSIAFFSLQSVKDKKGREIDHHAFVILKLEGQWMT